jgi:hypothetical protein
MSKSPEGGYQKPESFFMQVIRSIGRIATLGLFGNPKK